jgi:quinol monooxygenase YgiN
VWQTRAAFEAHTALPHTVQYREKLHGYLGSPYDERIHAAIP